MHTPYVPNSSKATNRVPKPVPRTEANCEPCDYGLDRYKQENERTEEKLNKMYRSIEL